MTALRTGATTYDNILQPRVSAVPAKRGADWLLRLVLVYLILEYLRPMDIAWFSFLQYIRPALMLAPALGVTWVFSQRKARSSANTTKWFLAFLLLLAAYVPLAVNNRNAWHAMKDVTLAAACYLGITACIDSPAKLRRLHRWITWTTLCLSVRGILKFQGITGDFDGFGLFLGDENDFCLLMVVLFPFVYLPILSSYSYKAKLLCLIATCSCVLSIVVSHSRGGFLGFVVVASYCWIKSPRKVISLFLVLVLGLVLFMAGGEAYRQEISSIGTATERGETGRTRLIAWKAGFMMFLAHPLGVGGQNYQYNLDQYNGYFNAELQRSLAGRLAHSLYFTALPELGIFGVVILPGLFLSAIGNYRRSAKKLAQIDSPEADKIRIFAIAGIGGMLGYLSAGVFVSVLYYPHAYYLAAFSVVVAKLTSEMTAQSTEERGETV